MKLSVQSNAATGPKLSQKLNVPKMKSKRLSAMLSLKKFLSLVKQVYIVQTSTEIGDLGHNVQDPV